MEGIEKYVDWHKLWKAINLHIDVDTDEDQELHDLVESFKKDDKIELLPEECYVAEDSIWIVFGEEGGKSEGDPQGWSREYAFSFNSDLACMSGEYQQG